MLTVTTGPRPLDDAGAVPENCNVTGISPIFCPFSVTLTIGPGEMALGSVAP